ncbi:arylsulfatase [candidate division KSB1 bacterium]
MSEWNRRKFLKTVGLGTAALSLSQFEFCSLKDKEKPNIIFILADDLGYNELGCYGQTKIRTPNIDKLAEEGMKFTQHYSGSPVCAPSRCTLLTGKHTGHAYIRDNDEMTERGDVWRDRSIEGQRPLLPNTVTIGTLLQNAGYKTGAIGKWGLGGPEDTGHPNKQGFDHWYGYLCQRVAHNYYPTHLWRNGEKDILEGNDYFYPHQKLPEDKDPNDRASYEPYRGKVYSQDPMAEEALNFIRENKDNPFFLYLPFIVPHVSIQVPEDSLAEYEGEFEDTPYKGEKGYLPHPAPRAGYAAMITRMDREIGRIMDLLKELGIDDNTLVVFTSDNGPTFNGGTDSEFFNSAGPLRGLKTQVYEGGIRVPMIARWNGKIKPGTVSNHISAFWDFMPTFADLLDIDTQEETDGISILPTLLGNSGKQEEHEYLYWEYRRQNQAVRMGDWKAVRLKPSDRIQLYNLRYDIGEKEDVADRYPEIVDNIAEIMKNGRTESEHFPIKWQ